MATEKKATGKKVMDVTNPKKVTPSATSRPVIVTNRPMIQQDPMVSGSDETQVGEISKSEQPTAPLLEPSKATATIQPIHIKDGADESEKADEKPPVDDATPEPVTPDEAVNKEPAAEEPAKAEEATPVATEEGVEKPAEGEEPSADAKPEAEESKEPEARSTDNTEEKPEKTDEPDGKQPPFDDAAAAKEAAVARQRAEEMQKLINSRQYYVPVNAIERKRSTRTSLLLTLLMIFLSIALIDLMLDANVIELIQKLPHTHFFEAR